MHNRSMAGGVIYMEVSGTQFSDQRPMMIISGIPQREGKGLGGPLLPVSPLLYLTALIISEHWKRKFNSSYSVYSLNLVQKKEIENLPNAKDENIYLIIIINYFFEI